MVPITIKVIDSGESTAGPVIRADAFKLALFQELTDTKDYKSVAVPSEFKLFQNYPNPFNPRTTISWQSPISSWQTLKVYDILGNEVVTLVDEFYHAGSYEIDFDATKLASGIYFYRLQAGNFIETKSMILQK